MKKHIKTISSILISLCLISSTFVYADEAEINKIPEILASDIQTIEIDTVEDENGITVEELKNKIDIADLNNEVELENTKNIAGKARRNKKSINNLKVTKELNSKSTRAENTDPNNAYVLPLNQGINGTITVVGQQRWYGTVIEEKTKLTTYLEMPSNCNYDLYMLKLDTATMNLNLVAYSLNNTGESEIIDYIAEPGIYYFWVDGYLGTGNFGLITYGMTNNIKNEPNDSFETATSVSSTNFTVTDAIDNPFDFDYFKADYSSSKFVNINFTKPANSDYTLYISKNGTGYTQVENGTYDLEPGTYYYHVRSLSGNYDENATYTLEVNATSYNDNMGILCYSKNLDMIFQSSGSGSYYVNGNYISYNYYFESETSSSNTTMELSSTSSSQVVLTEYEIDQLKQQAEYYDADIPVFVKYNTNWQGSTSKDKALLITLYNVDLDIDRVGDGSYHLDDYPIATVLVDIDTGDILDLFWPNYYYMTGNFRHEWFSIYNTQYNYNTRGY